MGPESLWLLSLAEKAATGQLGEAERLEAQREAWTYVGSLACATERSDAGLGRLFTMVFERPEGRVASPSDVLRAGLELGFSEGALVRIALGILGEEPIRRGEGLASSVPAAEQDDARRLSALVREELGVDPAAPAESERLRELARLSELLARRSARAMPLSALGRATQALGRGEWRAALSIFDEYLSKLEMFGA